jgi:hypothetical protein
MQGNPDGHHAFSYKQNVSRLKTIGRRNDRVTHSAQHLVDPLGPPAESPLQQIKPTPQFSSNTLSLIKVQP